MAYLIGTDEAGYGPNMGPLVVSATVWQVADELRDADLYDTLRAVIARGRCADSDDKRMSIADSKQLYQPGGGLRELERGVLPPCQATGRRVASWREMLTSFCPDSASKLDDVPWFREFDHVAPRDASSAEIEQLSGRFADCLRNATVSFGGVQSTIVCARNFNQSLQTYNNKATLLSHITLELVKRVVDLLDAQPIIVHCDKHGGRSKYAALLQQFFPDDLVEIIREGREESVYRCGPRTRRIDVRFVARGERFLPTALASMASKYVRELAMIAFNDFWRQHLPDLRPTAGYPLDARRFSAAIRDVRMRLAIAEQDVWRAR